MRIAHVITRLILGGAGEYALRLRGPAADLRRQGALDHRSGAGAGGKPVGAGQGRGGAAGDRPFAPPRDSILARPWRPTGGSRRPWRSSGPRSSTPTAPRPASSAARRPARFPCRRSSTGSTAPFHPYQGRGRGCCPRLRALGRQRRGTGTFQLRSPSPHQVRFRRMNLIYRLRHTSFPLATDLNNHEPNPAGRTSGPTRPGSEI